MASNKFTRLNAKANGQPVKETPSQTDTQTNRLTNTQTNKPSDNRVFDPMFTKMPAGSGVKLTIDDFRPLLIQVGKETRSFSLHQIEKNALDRATFLLKVQGLKADANKIARAALTKALAELDEKGKDSFLYQMLENLSN